MPFAAAAVSHRLQPPATHHDLAERHHNNNNTRRFSSVVRPLSIHFKILCRTQNRNLHLHIPHSLSSSSSSPSSSSSTNLPRIRFNPSTRLYISGLSFRTTEESLRNAFSNFGDLLEVNLVMDKIAKRPRGFAFVTYATEEESNKAIQGMHGKFLDGRVIFVEIAKPRPQLRQDSDQH